MMMLSLLLLVLMCSVRLPNDTVWQEIMLGDCDVVLTGGAESMSQAPHILRGIRFGIPLGRDQVVRS